MPKLACNYSEALKDLIINNQVDIDYIKTGAFGEFEAKIPEMRLMKPVMLHGLGHFERTGMKNIDIVDFKRANDLISFCGSFHYGLHLAITNADMPKILSDEEIHAIMDKNIKIFKKNINVPLLLENVPDSPEDRTVYDHCPFAEADIISKVVNDNKTYMLLDLSHAGITAEFRDWDVYGYLSGLPLNRVKEIHVNGYGHDEQGYPCDPHIPMDDSDFERLEWVLKHCSPDIITLEYNGVGQESIEEIKENLIKQLKELNRIIGDD